MERANLDEMDDIQGIKHKSWVCKYFNQKKRWNVGHEVWIGIFELTNVAQLQRRCWWRWIRWTNETDGYKIIRNINKY